MRIYKMKGSKPCVVCGKMFQYYSIKSKYCSDECDVKHKQGDKGKITLAFIPKHLMEERHED